MAGQATIWQLVADGGGPPPYTFPSNGVLDNFNRANESPLGGGWSANPYWFGDTLHKVVANQCEPVTGGFSDMVWATNFNANQEVYVKIVNVSTLTSVGLYCRAINENTGGFTNQYIYADFTIATGAVKIEVEDGGGSPLLGSGSIGGAIVNGDSIGFSCNGTALKAYYKSGGGAWSTIVSATSARHNVSGKIVCTTDSGGGYVLDDFGGGNI